MFNLKYMYDVYINCQLINRELETVIFQRYFALVKFIIIIVALSMTTFPFLPRSDFHVHASRAFLWFHARFQHRATARERERDWERDTVYLCWWVLWCFNATYRANTLNILLALRTCPRNNDCQLPQLEHRIYRTKRSHAAGTRSVCEHWQFSTNRN